jgi:hypothetical protein
VGIVKTQRNGAKPHTAGWVHIDGDFKTGALDFAQCGALPMSL